MQVKQMNQETKEKFFRASLKIGHRLPQVLCELLELDPSFCYWIQGGSDLGGAPLRRYINSYNPVKERIKTRKKPIRVLGNAINERVSVVDLVCG